MFLRKSKKTCLKRTPIKRVSNKQRAINVEIRRIKRELDDVCCICHRPAINGDAMHLLPRSLYMEYITEPWNIRIGCRTCHEKYDNDLSFRQQQTHIFEHLCKYDEQAARRYFRIYDIRRNESTSNEEAQTT